MKIVVPVIFFFLAFQKFARAELQLDDPVKQKPRVVLGYISDKDWAFMEFISMTHASWRYITSLTPSEGEQPYKMDMLAFVHPKFAPQAGTICTPLNLKDADNWSDLIDPHTAQCFAMVLPPPDPTEWHGYPFINNVHFAAVPEVEEFLTENYGYAVKTDFDTFLSPSLFHFWPDRFTFGVQEYVLMDETKKRLEGVAKTLNLRPPVHHNLGPTWYGDVRLLLKLAKLSIPIMHHIITKEFEQSPRGGIKQAWYNGEGWPQWSAGAAALYATELAANHLIPDLISTYKMDEHGDSQGLVANVYHIHCRHGDGQFSKFDFFQHQYNHVDITKLDTSVISDYCTFLAASTWRQLVDIGAHQKAAPGLFKDMRG